MTCQELIEFLDAYHENRISPDERDLFEQHLALCADCRNYLDSYRTTIRLEKAALKPAAEQSLPPALIAAILAARGRDIEKK